MRFVETIDAVKSTDGCVRLVARSLTDSSVVFDVCFYDEHDTLLFTLAPATEKKALALFESIKDAVE